MPKDAINKTVTIMIIGILIASIAFGVVGFVHWALTEPDQLNDPQSQIGR